MFKQLVSIMSFVIIMCSCGTEIVNDGSSEYVGLGVDHPQNKIFRPATVEDCENCGAQPEGCKPTNNGEYCGCLWTNASGVTYWHSETGITELGCDTPAAGGSGEKCYWPVDPT